MQTTINYLNNMLADYRVVQIKQGQMINILQYAPENGVDLKASKRAQHNATKAMAAINKAISDLIQQIYELESELATADKEG